ncbi:MAG TPA: helix-turn-helix domain-containing protein [Jatrophihabitans sp.]|nr:helix-turn-helix domain-containing protein [Jatrophihabitans sp.]
MPRPPALDQDKKTELILDVLAGRCNLSQAAMRAGVSAQAVANWRRQFIEGGSRAMQSQCALRATREQNNLRLRQLFHEVQQLKIALAEAHLAMHGPHGLGRLDHGGRSAVGQRR